MSKNAIMVIRPYKFHSQWVFDDESRGLDKEPFVAGADTMIDLAVKQIGINNPDQGFLMVFSATPFPGHHLRLEHVREESEGNTYVWQEQQVEGWLCPALGLFFDSPPKEIFVQLKNEE